MGRQEMREKVASELFATAVREEHLPAGEIIANRSGVAYSGAGSR
jgi:hypothetical protein